MVEWSKLQDAFERDGALRDIYVRDVDVATWERALAFLRSVGDLRYTVDQVDSPLPSRAADALACSGEAVCCLVVARDGIEYACHFFTADEIEIDFWPEQVNGPDRLASLERFVAGLGHATARDVVVTQENWPEALILRYVSATGEVVQG